MNNSVPLPVLGAGASALEDVIRADIRRGRYHPRERLVEAELAERYGVNRSAARSALLHLAAEGLVERLPNRGARVRSMTPDEAIEITEARFRLQAMCAARAAERGTAEQRQKLLAQLEVLRTAVSAVAHGEYSEAAARVSGMIREIGGHTTANRIIEQLNNHNAPQLLPVMLSERRFDSLPDLEATVAAVTAGDGAGAHAATIAHMERVVGELRRIRDSTAEPIAEA